MSVLWLQQIRDFSETTSVKFTLIQSDLSQQYHSRWDNVLYFDQNFNDLSHFILTGSTDLLEMLFLFQVTSLPDLKQSKNVSEFKVQIYSVFQIFDTFAFGPFCPCLFTAMKSPQELLYLLKGEQIDHLHFAILFLLACCPWDKGKSSITSAENPICLIWTLADDHIPLIHLEFLMQTWNGW